MKITLVILSIVWTFVYGDRNCTNTRDGTIDNVYLRYYNGTFGEYIDIQLGSATNLLNGISKDYPSMMYFFGFTECPTSLSVEHIATAYFTTRPQTNIIVVDWSNMNSGLYTTAAKNTKIVGEAVAKQVYNLVTGGLALDTLHVIGHSLGGELAGYMGRNLKDDYNTTLPRITALDPAGPDFYPDGVFYHHLKASDATFVDVIHTDAGGFGIPVSCGTVDFWPNGGGAIQPGCKVAIPLTTKSYCSHKRSWYYYAASVMSPKIFPASPKTCITRSKTNPEEGFIYMGIDCPTGATGSYYLKTNSSSPYGEGTAGLYC